MKPLLVAAAILVAATTHHLVIAPALGRVVTESLGEEARLALDMRCGAPDSNAAIACRDHHERLFASGALDPDRTLRMWCDEVRTAPWGRRHSAPPRVCVERYGGW